MNILTSCVVYHLVDQFIYWYNWHKLCHCFTTSCFLSENVLGYVKLFSACHKNPLNLPVFKHVPKGKLVVSAFL